MILKLKKLRENAIPLKKSYDNPAGIDLSIVEIIKIENGIVYCGTGWAFETPDEYYTEIVPRSSMHKHGWTLANNIGIIDSDYRGEIIVALQPTSVLASSLAMESIDKVKTMYEFKNLYLEDTAPITYIDLMSYAIMESLVSTLKTKLPIALVQVLVRKKENINLCEVNELTETKRGDGGFGSSDKLNPMKVNQNE